MALKFFNDYDKVNKPVTSSDGTVQGTAPVTAPAAAPEAMTVDDMKAYFDSMKESLVNDIVKQIRATAAPDPEFNNEKEGDINASDTDLLNS